MNAENERIFPAFLPSDWFDEEGVYVPVIGTLVSKAFDICELKLFPKRIVEVCQFAGVAVFEIGDINIVRMLKIIGQINHLVFAEIKVNGSHGARPVRDLGD